MDTQPRAVAVQVAYSLQVGYAFAMGSVLAALALLGVLLGSAFVGTCMVLCAREHWSGMSSRVRRFVRPQRDDVLK